MGFGAWERPEGGQGPARPGPALGLFTGASPPPPPAAEPLAVMSVDVGSESMKIAIVKPGVPMEIVLNK